MISNSNNIPQAVILAGGKGTRLRPITYKVPKVMIVIKGKPFLQHVLELLRNKGVSNILLLISYLGDQIESYFGNGDKFGLKITYSREGHPLGTGGALKKAEELIEDEFLLINGDTYLDFEYKLLINKFKDLNCVGLICIYGNKDKKMEPNVLLDLDKRIINYDKIDSEGLVEVDAGIGIFKKEVLNLIPEKINVSFENQIYNKLIREKQLYGYPINQPFLDIGEFKRLNYAKEILQ